MILKKYKIAFVIFSIFYTGIFAQTNFIEQFYSKVPTKKFLLKSWNSDNGLPQNSVNDIAQTKDGYLWFATFDGLVRFNGSQFVVYNQSNIKLLKTNRISALSIDSSGGLWVGTESGQILVYKQNRFIDFTDKLNTKEFSVSHIQTLSNGDICIVTKSDLIVYNKNEIKHYPHSTLYTGDHIFNIIRNKKKELEILSNLGFEVIRNDSVRLFTNINFSNFNLVNGYKADKTNWFNSKFIVSYVDRQIAIRRKNVNKIITHINNVFIDSKQRLWVATWNGLILETEEGEFRFKNKNLKEEIYKIFEDVDGNIWVGTATKGVIQLSRRSIFNITLKKGVFNDVIYPVLQRKNGEIWVGSNGGGLARIIGNKVDYFSQEDGLNNLAIWSLFEDSNNKLWFGSYGGGLFCWNEVRFKKFALWDSLVSKSVFVIYGDKQGGLWIGTDAGVHYYKDKKIYHYSVNDGLSNNKIRAISEADDGTIWFATDDGLTYLKDKEFHKLPIQGSYKAYSFRSLYIDKTGRLWAGTYGQGLYSYLNGKLSVIKKENGLFDNVVSTILEDGNSNFWMTSNHGLYRAARKNLLSFINGEIKEIYSIVYQKDEGFLSNEFNGGQMPSSCILEDSTLLFPSISGLVAVDPSLGKSTTKYHRIYIDRVSVNGKSYTASDNITIPSSDNNVVFYFSVIEFNKPKQVRLRYKIENLINEWTDISNIRTINFADIAPGNYELKLEEKSGIGNWRSVSHSIKFSVKASFYQSVGFYFLIIILFTVVIFILAQLRFRSLKKRNDILAILVKERTQKIETEKENTLKALEEVRKEKEKVDCANREKTDLMRIVAHDLKNPISAVSGSVDLIISNSADTETVQELASIIKNATSESLEMIMQFLNQSEVEDPRYSLEINKVNIIDLLRGTIYGNKVIADRKGQNILFDYTGKSEILVEIDENKITSVLNNLISNAIKYSPKNKDIKITFEDQDDRIKICVIDNGPGLNDEDHKYLFNKFTKLSARPTGNETSTGLGLSIVKRIVELHGGEVGVESVFGEGSNFFVILAKNTNIKTSG